jgi:hypothetical protein
VNAGIGTFRVVQQLTGILASHGPNAHSPDKAWVRLSQCGAARLRLHEEGDVPATEQ